MKRCRKCNLDKSNHEFYRYRRVCIQCYNRGCYYRSRHRMPKGIAQLPEPAMSERQIAQQLGISRQRVQQIIHTALSKLKEKIDSEIRSEL